jgi:DNA repair exonuclease SbcCD ATPase subunit
MNPDRPIHPGEGQRAGIHRERVEAIEGLREQIKALEEREPELRRKIPEFERAQRKTIAELQKTQRMTIAELQKSQRMTIAKLEQTLRTKPENADELDEELARTRDELDEELARTRDELDEELARTRTELDEELAGMRAELASIGPALIGARCRLGMKMSDFALEDHEGHEQAIEYLKPLLAELRNEYARALRKAESDVAEAAEKLRTLEAEHRDTAEAALPVVEERYRPLIDAEVIGVTIEQAKVRVTRHRLALVDPEDNDARLARELELEAGLDELDAARAKVSVLQEEQRAVAYHYAHPTMEKSKRLREMLAKRLGLHH